MKGYMILALSMALLSGCAQYGGKGGHPNSGHTPPDEGKNAAGDTIVAGFALRKIDDVVRTKLGLKPEDVLVALTNDGNATQNTIVYVSEEFTAAPGKFTFGKKLEKFVQIFMLRDGPLCTAIADGGSGMMLSGCAQYRDKGEHPTGQTSSDRAEGSNEAGDRIAAGFALRKMDDTLRAKLGLKPEDMLVALTNDGNTTQNTIVYASEGLTLAPGKFTPGMKLEKFVQIFMLRGSPVCAAIADGGGGMIHYPRRDCPH